MSSKRLRVPTIKYEPDGEPAPRAAVSGGKIPKKIGLSPEDKLLGDVAKYFESKAKSAEVADVKYRKLRVRYQRLQYRTQEDPTMDKFETAHEIDQAEKRAALTRTEVLLLEAQSAQAEKQAALTRTEAFLLEAQSALAEKQDALTRTEALLLETQSALANEKASRAHDMAGIRARFNSLF